MRRDDTVHGSVHWHRQVVNRKPNEFDAAVTAAIVQRHVAAASNDQAGPVKTPIRERPRIVDDSALPIGHRLCDRYEIVEHVHVGGMSHVYKALDRRRRWGNKEPKHVAIKMLRESTEAAGCEGLIEREAEKAMQLSHPNIVNVYDFDQHAGKFFLVMEWLSGESLNELLRRTEGRRLAADYVDRVIDQVARAVRYTHSQGIVHADINPANVFLTDTQQVKLLDFGVARDVSEDKSETPVWSTHAYSSPEVLEGQKPEFEDDVYSLACIAYRLHAGHLPYDALSALEARDSDEPLTCIEDLGPMTQDRILRGLAYRRTDRPQRAGVFAKGDWAARVVDGLARLDRLVGNRWRVLVPATAVAALVLLTLTNQPTPVPPEPAAAVAASVVAQVEPVVATPSPEPTQPPPLPVSEGEVEGELARTLRDAGTAFADGRLIEPENQSARALYRDALMLDENNDTALAGLRRISNLFAERARTALADNDVEQALAQLTHAAETDAANPAVPAIVQTYEAMGLSAIAQARLALADGAIGRAGRHLNAAERFPNIEASLIRELRTQRNRIAAEQRLRDDLKPLDEHLAAGRLISPAGENALGVLRALKETHTGSSELEFYSERLAERLLARAALAMAEGRHDEAENTLGIAATLDVLEPELAAAQVSLQLARQVPAVQEEPPLTIMTDGARVTVSPVTAVASPHSVGTAGDVSIRELIPPEVPRRAFRRAPEGHVELLFIINPNGATSNIAVTDSTPEDVFVSSAVDALERWRFARRLEPTEAHVKISFERR